MRTVGRFKVAMSVATSATIACSSDTCPTCGAHAGYRVYCAACDTDGCTACLGMPKASDCRTCGRGPVLALQR